MSPSLGKFIDQCGSELMIAFISLAVGSGVTLLVSFLFFRKTLRDAEGESEALIRQALRDDILNLKTSPDNPQNAQERIALAEEELAKARKELVLSCINQRNEP